MFIDRTDQTTHWLWCVFCEHVDFLQTQTDSGLAMTADGLELLQVN
jgi:hypothetical protein